jgi:hypothetical protein
VRFQLLADLGRVDEFDQAEASGETDDSSKISFRLFAAKRDPFEAFEASEACSMRDLAL